MNELVYVLAVEALVFGALCTVVLAQRLDVFHWPADRTWPVLASSLQALLLNAHALVLLCCFVAAGRFASYAPDVRDACARSAGRLATATALGAVYVAVLLAARGDASDCVLCQLLGTSCAQPETLFWSASYAAFLAVLLPVAALQAALLVAAAGMCKEQRVAPRRLATANCALLIAMQVQTALQLSSKYLPARCASGSAGGASQRAPADLLAVGSTPHVIVSIQFFYALDAVADFCASLVLEGRAGLYLPVFFTVCRAAAVALVWILQPLFSDSGVFPPPAVLLAHSALAAVLAAFDLADVWLKHVANSRANSRARDQQRLETLHALEHDRRVEVADVAKAPAADPRGRSLRAAFEVEPARRRRFMLTFNNKARWPAQAAEKKTM